MVNALYVVDYFACRYVANYPGACGQMLHVPLG